MSLAATRRELLLRFRAMYQAKHFELYLFDLDDGYLQTTLSDEDRMPLRFFVEYNNAWWFAIISGVSVPAIAYDEESDSGSILRRRHPAGDAARPLRRRHDQPPPHVRVAGVLHPTQSVGSPGRARQRDVARHRLRPRRIETGGRGVLAFR